MAPASPGPPEPRSRRLRRSDRLRASRDFQRVARSGRRASSGPLVVLAAPREGEGTGDATQGAGSTGMRLGITASRRVGGAVVRNRVKRRIREWFRNSPLREAAPVDLVVIVRPGGASLASSALADELEGLTRRVLRLLDRAESGPDSGQLEAPR